MKIHRYTFMLHFHAVFGLVRDWDRYQSIRREISYRLRSELRRSYFRKLCFSFRGEKVEKSGEEVVINCFVRI